MGHYDSAYEYDDRIRRMGGSPNLHYIDENGKLRSYEEDRRQRVAMQKVPHEYDGKFIKYFGWIKCGICDRRRYETPHVQPPDTPPTNEDR